jgi:hypothetical protein
MWPRTQVDTVMVCPITVHIDTLPSASFFTQFTATHFGLSLEARTL